MTAAWFQYTYLKYPPGTPVETWKGKEVDSPAVRAQFERRGEDPKGPIDGQTYSRSLSLAPGETKTALDLSGQGAITSLRLAHDALVAGHVLPHPAAHHLGRPDDPGRRSCPLARSSAPAATPSASRTSREKRWPRSASASTPRRDNATPTGPCPTGRGRSSRLLNEGKTAISRLDVEAASASPQAMNYRRGESGYFCAKRTVDISPDKALYSQAFQVGGRGKVVGLTMYSTGYNMDGDEYHLYRRLAHSANPRRRHRGRPQPGLGRLRHPKALLGRTDQRIPGGLSPLPCRSLCLRLLHQHPLRA